MTYYAVGESTGKIYATGTKIDCLRKIQEQYPYQEDTRGNRKGLTKSLSTLLPETIIIVRNEVSK